MTEATGLPGLVEALTELYQPVYGHPEFDARARRPTDDRLGVIAPLVREFECWQRVAALLFRLQKISIPLIDAARDVALVCVGQELAGAAMEPRGSIQHASPSFLVRFRPRVRDARAGVGSASIQT